MTDSSSQALSQRISAVSPTTARVSVRRQQFDVGRPLEFDVEADRVSAVDHALGALGAEVVGGLQDFARRRRLVLDQIEAVVRSTVDHPLAYLEVVGEDGRPRLGGIHVKVYVSTDEAAESVERLWRDTLERLPLVRTLRGAVALELELAITM